MLKLIPASEYCDNIFDGTHDTPKPKTEGKPLITSKHILKDRLDIANAYNISFEDYNEINKRSRIRQWDILFSMIGTIGNIYLEESNNINYAIKNMGVFSCGNEKKARYLYYYLQSNFAKQYINQKLAGAVQKFLSLGELRSFPVPSFDEQLYNSISILSWIDKKIELNNRINTELEVMAKELYNYWFIQFDFPDEFRRPYKSSGGKMVYNDVLKREIPEGWTVENIADNKLSKILKPGIKQFDGQKIYLPTAAIENDRIIDKSNLITYNNREGRANMEPVDNSVWFAKMKNTKKVLYFGDYSSQRISQTILSTGMLGLKCVENALEYIWNFVNDDSFEAVKNKLSHGATQEGVNNDDLLYFPMLIPSIETLRDYSVLVKDLYKQKYFNEIENECLAKLRDFLLPMLMNGQVSVS